MTMRDEDFGATLTLSEADDGFWSPSMAASVCAPPDGQSLYEQAEARVQRERTRAHAAEARAEEWLVAQRGARSQAGSLKSILDKSRDKLKALRHADETGWRVQEYRRHGRSSRAWLWISVSEDAVYYLIDPSRSAKVAKSLFGDTERGLRCAVIRRRLSFGSNSEDGAKFTAIMPSVVGTLLMHGIDVLRWLEAWLTACAKNGGKPPDDLSPWLPWTMSEARKRKFTAPG